MKNWFPFTNYDFYAYLTCGALALAVFDFVATGGDWLGRERWTFTQIVLGVAAAYVVGQLVASVSGQVLEHWLVRTALAPPAAVQLAARRQGVLGRWIGRVAAGRYYAPLPEAVREKIWSAAASKLEIARDALTDPEAVFQVAFRAARSDVDTRERIDDFRNLYGFSRNIAAVALVSSVVLAVQAARLGNSTSIALAIVSAVVGVGMLARFLKFYAAFAAEVLRSLIR